MIGTAIAHVPLYGSWIVLLSSRPTIGAAANGKPQVRKLATSRRKISDFRPFAENRRAGGKLQGRTESG